MSSEDPTTELTDLPESDGPDDIIESVPDEEPSPSWAVSICFWSAILIAAGTYTAVALSPKLAVWNQVRHEYRRNAKQLVSLDSEVDYLERVRSALESDPEFVRQLSGLSGSERQDGSSEFIPVSGTLLFGNDRTDDSAAESVAVDPPYHTLITTLARHTRLRTGLLIFSACLTLFAFAFLNDAGSGLVHSAGRVIRATATLPARRYFGTNETPPEEDQHDVSDEGAEA